MKNQERTRKTKPHEKSRKTKKSQNLIRSERKVLTFWQFCIMIKEIRKNYILIFYFDFLISNNFK